MRIKVGLLFSLTGTTSMTERGQYEAARFAISQFEKQTYSIETVVRDICSDPAQAAKEAESLAKNGVKLLIGCYTSACRKAVLPIIEKYHILLVYPTLYEGQENHPNVFYTGEVPNQQVHTLIDYLMNQYGTRIYLIGNDYIYPRETNAQVKAYINEKRGEIAGEKYVPFGYQEFHEPIQDIILTNPDAIFSTLVGQSVLSFYRMYKQMGLAPQSIPIFSPITKETEVAAMGVDVGAGHYSSASYFQSLSNPLNDSFLKQFYQSINEKQPVSSVMFNTYLGTKIVLEAIIKTNSLKPERIFQFLSGRKLDTACGMIHIDGEKRHLSRPVKIGKALPNGQFEIVWNSTKMITPKPFKAEGKEKSHLNEVVLLGWGKISEEALLALSQNGTIQYMSQKAKELTGLVEGESLTVEHINDLKEAFEVRSYEADYKKLYLLKHKSVRKIEPVFKFGTIQTRNPSYQLELETAYIASQSTANVLILGETGTGKEVMARSIHEQSERKDGPFIAVNTGLIPKDLIASELFGYVEGTFTGARKGGAIGKFEAAHQGTLFLDEIGDMPLELQVILLRAIETKRIVRLGDTHEREVDIRIIAATNRNLEEEIAYNDSFRSDLFYRLNVLSIHIPPLRERTEDIEELAWNIFEQLQKEYDYGPKRMSDEVMHLFIEYPWPGNIRELRNVIERAFLLARGRHSEIVKAHLPTNVQGYFTRKRTSQLSLREIEKKCIQQALHETRNVSEASSRLGIARSTLYRKIKEYNISL